MEMIKVTLKEMCDIVPGYAFKSSDFGSGDNFAVKITDIQPPSIDVMNLENVSAIPKDDRTLLSKGDFVMAMTGATIGKVGLFDGSKENVYINQRVCKFIPKDGYDKSFLYYLVSQPNFRKFIFANVDSSSAQPNIGHPTMYRYEQNVPTLDGQKKIASVLSALDDKIALNKKMNQKLEAMAKRLYDYWFVQYDFPDKNGHPYKTTGGPMTYNPTLKREIPAGWEVVDINELCQVVDCLHSKKPDYCYEDENSYLLALENITKEGYIDLSDKYYISKKDFAEWTSRICVKENDFLFTNAGRAGDMGMVPEGVLCAIGRNITAVRPEKINPWYLRCFFKSLYMQEQILNNLDQGSFFMSFNVRSIKKLLVLMPSEPLMKKFISFVEPHLKRIEKNNKEISRLTKLRDKLLPLLMNGQVVVG
ncbi:restriction endonuclease subunit S [Fibrobacter sp. UWB7]|uniref:restriction endonuclease subunit S n=1 Tax=Fibrobacter sp. UWB7 TaxID=1896206 RepID=UPI000911881D|nr:restriction endonuclease subunit S [Fibrobacter sp. UWB7]SHM94438.1 type I restriction enzyme, S subunit [Fibrobacter sp. UWB7]